MALHLRRLGLLTALAAAACGPEPVPVPPPRAEAPAPAAPATTLSFDPGEAGISDIARVSRFVFREMNARTECPLEALPPGRYDYVYDVTVAKGRITGARLASVSHLEAAGSHAVPAEQWPPALDKRLGCLLPHLKKLELSPAPADGTYATRFVAGSPS